MEMTRRHQIWPSIVYGLGLFLLYLGQRILSLGTSSTVATLLGLAMVAGALVVRLIGARSSDLEARRPERALAALYALGLAALLFHFASSDAVAYVAGRGFAGRWPRVTGILGALWPALLVAGTLPVIFVEMTLAGMKRAPVLDHGRVRAALYSGLGISFALVFVFTAAYVAAERNKKLDLSYFRTAKAGESTKKLVRALDKPVQIALFFPPANEVAEEVDSYFGDLTKESKFLSVSHFDYALHPAKAKELGVSGNGIIVIGRDGLREQIPVPVELERARSQLRVLDQEVNKRIIGVSRKDRVAYLTQGHEERTFDAVGDTDRRGTIKTLRDMLVDQGFEPRELGMAQGLGSDVPADAGLVLIIGPQKPFLKEELDALVRYLDRKGRLLVALDPETGVKMDELFSQLSLKYTPVTLANDQMYWRRTYQTADHANIATGAYSSHASVSTIQRFGSRMAFVLVGAGYLEKEEKGAAGIVNVDFTVHAHPATWADKNGNFTFDQPDETRNAYEVAAAVSKRNASALLPEDEARVVVLTDSDALTDLLFQNRGNAYFALDAVRWLSGEATDTGMINTEEDVPIAHTRKEDLAWFYSTIFAAPAALVGIGFAVTRRRRVRKRKAAEGSPPPPAPPATEVSP